MRVWPDPKYFESADLPRGDLLHLLRSKAVLMPGVTVTLVIEKGAKGDVERHSWVYKGGLSDYLTQTLTADPLIPLFEGAHYADRGETENFAEGEGAAWCVAFTEEGAPTRESYVNLIPTVAGGTHESGLKDGLFGAIKGVHRIARTDAERGQADARRRVLARQLRAECQGARPAIPGADQGAAQFARCVAPGLDLCQAGTRAVVEPAMSNTAESSPSWSFARRRHGSARR